MDGREYGEQEVSKNAIVVGSGGQVAGALLRELRAREFNVLPSSSSQKPGTLPLDLGSPASIREFFGVARAKLGEGPVEVFLPGALTHVDRCEEDRDLCRRINEEGPALVAEECARFGYGLTFFSTEYVFGEAEYHGGAMGPFTEEDPPAPTSYYGRCKLEAEKKILSILGEARALVVRTTMVFSYNPQGNNFLMQYLKQLGELEAGRNPNVFKIPVDQISTPSYAPALAADVCALRERGIGGMINLCGSSCLSRKEILEKVIAVFGFDPEKARAGFVYQQTAEMGQKARRPLTAGLTVDKARRLGLRVLSLDEALALALAEKKRLG